MHRLAPQPFPGTRLGSHQTLAAFTDYFNGRPSPFSLSLVNLFNFLPCSYHSLRLICFSFLSFFVNCVSYTYKHFPRQESNKCQPHGCVLRARCILGRIQTALPWSWHFPGEEIVCKQEFQIVTGAVKKQRAVIRG